VFVLQARVIEHILSAEREVEAKSAAPTAVDPNQQTVTEELKDATRRRTVDWEPAKACIGFLSQPMGRSLHARLGEAYATWSEAEDDPALLAAVLTMAEQFGKDRSTTAGLKRLRREGLELICFDYLTG
jgi:hypothetical protein